jgi:predicted GTPase
MSFYGMAAITPFFTSDLEIVIADPHRPGHELLYFPGEVNLRRADVVVINKVDSASPQNVELVRKNIHTVNPNATVIKAASRVAVAKPAAIKGRRVLVVEDGPTVTHGEMPYGAGVIAAREFGAAEIVDPRPYAVGSIRSTFATFLHLTNILPAMGYSSLQRSELEETINSVPCELVLVATPIDLAHVIKLNKPHLRVTYEIEELGPPRLADLIKRFVEEHAPANIATFARAQVSSSCKP